MWKYCGINAYVYYVDMDYGDKDQTQEKGQTEFYRSHDHLQCGDRKGKELQISFGSPPPGFF